jgi:hypothetical protein
MDQYTAEYEESTIPATWVNMPAEAFMALQSHALLNAPFATGMKKFPLLLFSPGLKREFAAYTTLIEDLVSHGYIVASINHPYISGMTVFPDGRHVEVYLPADEAGSFDLVVADALFVLDTLTEWNADISGDQPFACRFDLDKAAMYGHSYGGSTAMGAATTDARLHAALNYDGPTFGAYIEEGATIPMFYFLSEEHEADPDLEVAWANLEGPGFMANLAGSAHMSYSDYPLILHDYAPLIPLWVLDMGTIDPNLALEIAHRYQRAFFDVYLKGAPIDDLLNIAGEHSEITMETKNVGR